MNTYKFSKNDTLAIKALAVMLMLIHHLFTFPDKLNNGAYFDNLFTFENGVTLEYVMGNFGKLCVALFMMLAGYGMYCSYQKNKENVDTLITKRLNTVYIKYWQIFIIFIPIGLIIGAEHIEHSLVRWVTNFFAIETTFNGEWWFFTIYILMILIFPIIIRWVDRKHANPWSDIILVLIINEFFNTSLLTFLKTNVYTKDYYGTFITQKIITLLVMIPMFLAGCYLAKYDVIAKIRNKIPSPVIAKLIGIAILAVTFILRKNWPMPSNWGWDRLDFIYACTFTIAFALILDGLAAVKNTLAFIGKQATGIWLIHSFFCYYYWQDFTYATQNPILIFIILFVISFALSYAIELGFNYLGKFTKQLCSPSTSKK